MARPPLPHWLVQAWLVAVFVVELTMVNPFLRLLRHVRRRPLLETREPQVTETASIELPEAEANRDGDGLFYAPPSPNGRDAVAESASSETIENFVVERIQRLPKVVRKWLYRFKPFCKPLLATLAVGGSFCNLLLADYRDAAVCTNTVIFIMSIC